MNVLACITLAGALVAAALTPAAAQNLPNGSYQQSCVNIYTQGPNLFASCTAPNGSRVASSINFTQCPRNADIGNNGGRLGCNGGGPPPGPGYGPGPGGPGGPRPGGPGGPGYGVPPGSYLQSCRHVHVEGRQLIASCTAPNGALVRSGMPLGACRHGDIANNNGRLGCNYR